MNGKDKIQELLEEGLHHYGLGETEKALACWRKVLRLEPSNETAREYIEIETGRPVEREREAAPEEEIVELAEEVTEDAAGREDFAAGQFYLNTGQLEKAISSFESADKREERNLLYWAHRELARAGLIHETVKMVGGRQRPLRLNIPLVQLIGAKKFTEEEGFVLSLLNGEMSLEDVTALSPLPRFKTYEILYRLFKEGLASAAGEK